MNMNIHIEDIVSIRIILLAYLYTYSVVNITGYLLQDVYIQQEPVRTFEVHYTLADE